MLRLLSFVRALSLKRRYDLSNQTMPTPEPTSLASLDTVLTFAQQLIRVPAQGGIDNPNLMIDSVGQWLTKAKLPFRILLGASDRQPKAIVCEIVGSKPGLTYCFDACLDTAPIGNLADWKYDPFLAETHEGWLYGRGAADSKTAVSIFCHLAKEFYLRRDKMSGRLVFLFDADEHTGQFAGVKEFIAQCSKPDALAIGYPGNQAICIGARGFYRAQISVYGILEHTGSHNLVQLNAIAKASRLVSALQSAVLPIEADKDFFFGPKLSVTSILGGQGYSVVPDRCTVGVDLRLTPSFGAQEAAVLIEQIVACLDKDCPSPSPSSIAPEESWPCYKLLLDSPLLLALQTNANKELGRTIGCKIAGPSNIGNYLSALGVPALCGFGPNYKNAHAANEGIELASIMPVYRSYAAAIEQLLF